jgi:hypothetical protein
MAVLSMSSATNCIVVAGVTLCYKNVGDLLDHETLQNILHALKQIDDRARELIKIIEQELINRL